MPITIFNLPLHEKRAIFYVMLVCIFFISISSSAQNKTLLMDKPGTFSVRKNALNGQGPDNYGIVCSCTNAESDAALKELVDLVAVFQKIPMLQDIKGFDGICDISGNVCNSKFGYGVQSWVGFYFRTWSFSKGREVQWKVEPPQWRFVVNMTEKFCSSGFNVSDYSNSYDATNPAFSPEGTHKATIALRELFFLPGSKEQVSPGIDRYNNTLVFFNPEQPAYWEQVTIREVFRLLLDYWKQVQDKPSMETIVPILTGEYNNFSEAEKDGYAYFGGNESISRIGSARNETPVMRPNPAYWNRNMPKSAIQFMLMEIPPKDELESEMDRLLKNQEGNWYKYRFLSELDIQALGALIKR